MSKKILFLLFLIPLCLSAQELSRPCGWYLIESKDGEPIYQESSNEYSIKDQLITLEYVKKIKIINSKTRPYKQIQLEFNDEGSLIWEKLTNEYAIQKKQICFIYNNQVITIVGISSKIASGKVSFHPDNYDLEKLFEELKKIVENKK